MSRIIRQASAGRLDHMAGWLFADLLLVLFLVGVGAQVTKLPSEPTVPLQKYVALQNDYDKLNNDFQKLQKEKIKIKDSRCKKVDIDSRLVYAEVEKDSKYDAELAQSLREQLKRYGDRKVALVLIWGWSPDIGRGTTIAENMEDPLKRALSKTFTEDTMVRTLWKGKPTEGKVELEMYFFEKAVGGKCRF